MIRVSQHAIDRYIERVAAVSREEALEAILAHTTVLNLAAAFGSAKVRLPSGVRLVVDNECVVTVVGSDKRRKVRPARDGIGGSRAGRTAPLIMTQPVERAGDSDVSPPLQYGNLTDRRSVA